MWERPSAAHAEDRPLDPVSAPVGEDVVAEAPGIGLPHVLPEGVVLSLLLDHDPHPDPVLPHGLGQDQIELVLADLAEAVPAEAGLLGLQPLEPGDRGGKGESFRTFSKPRVREPLDHRK